MMMPSSSVITPEATTQPHGSPALHVEAEEDPHDARGDQRRAENERQPHRGQQRIVERHEPGDNVENAEREPEQEPVPRS